MRASELERQQQTLHYVEIYVDEAASWTPHPQDDKRTETAAIWRFGLKYLSGREKDALQNEALETRARKRRGTTQYKFDRYMIRKRVAAIAEWDCLADEADNILPINEKNVGLLPGWICDILDNEIDDMNELGEELEGE